MPDQIWTLSMLNEKSFFCEIIWSGSPSPNLVKSARLLSSLSIHWRPAAEYDMCTFNILTFNLLTDQQNMKCVHLTYHSNEEYPIQNMKCTFNISLQGNYPPSVQTNPGRILVSLTWKQTKMAQVTKEATRENWPPPPKRERETKWKLTQPPKKREK